MALTKVASVFSLLLALTFPFTRPARAEDAAAYTITDSTTGFVLESYNGEKKLPVASLTKIATAMVVLDWSDSTKSGLDQLATVPDSAARLNGGQGSVGLQPGDRVT